MSEFMEQPLEPYDFLPVPDGYVVGPPDFVGIGFGKTGTTGWHQLLLQHQAVKPNRPDKKELAYFYHFGYNGISPDAIDTYHQAFAAPNQTGSFLKMNTNQLRRK